MHAVSGHHCGGSVALASPLKRNKRKLKAFDCFSKGFKVRVCFVLNHFEQFQGPLKYLQLEERGLNSA